MLSNIEIFGRTIPIYGICFYLGIILAVAAALVLCKYADFPRWEVIYSAVYAMIGGMVGSKLLFIAVSWRQILAYNLSFIAVLKGGFVFYGGLIGGFIGLWVYTKIYKQKLIPYMEIYAAVLPLGHAIGRVGCFFAGCCYGIPCSFGVVYRQTAGLTPLGVRLLPIQLIEAACLLVLFVALVLVFLKGKRNGTVTLVYVYSYSLIRFAVEFFRGDRERGHLLWLSTAQWICILLIITESLALIVYKTKRKGHH